VWFPYSVKARAFALLAVIVGRQLVGVMRSAVITRLSNVECLAEHSLAIWFSCNGARRGSPI